MGITKMKWEQDLTKDIKTNDSNFNDRDSPETIDGNPWDAISTDYSHQAMLERLLTIKDQCRVIVEIGVDAYDAPGFTDIFLEHKRPETIYIGIDINDKSYLNDPDKNIYTIQNSSSNYLENLEKIKSFGATEIDLLFIDGPHSINQVLDDWEYTNILSNDGLVGFHDTRFHPGPKRFLQALNTDQWEIEENACADKLDWGVGFVQPRKNK